MDFAAKEYKSAPDFRGDAGNGVSRISGGEILSRFFRGRSAVRWRTMTLRSICTLPLARSGERLRARHSVTLRAALVSPRFLFLANAQPHPDLRRLDSHSLASRISYFLWGSMPDELLFDIAAAGNSTGRGSPRARPRMLRKEQTLDFTKRFVDQWLRIRELDNDKAPDASCSRVGRG